MLSYSSDLNPVNIHQSVLQSCHQASCRRSHSQLIFTSFILLQISLPSSTHQLREYLLYEWCFIASVQFLRLEESTLQCTEALLMACSGSTTYFVARFIFFSLNCYSTAANTKTLLCNSTPSRIKEYSPNTF